MLADLFRTVAEVTLSTSCLVAVLLPLSPYLKKHFTVNCLLIIWLILSARLVIPYSIQFPDSVLRIPVPALSQQENVLVNANPDDNGSLNQLSPAPVITPPEQPSQEPGFDLSAKQAETMLVQNIVEVIWAAGAGLYITIHAAGYVLLRRSIRRYSKTVEDKELLDVFESIRHQLKLSGRRISLMIYGKIKSPMMTGFLRPAVILPAGMRYNAVELEMILKHELVHYQRKDIWTKLFLTCVNAIHWFNPLIYLMTAEINKLIENACDSEIIKNTDLTQRKIYSESILTAMSLDHGRQLGLTTYYHGGKKIMKQRLVNIFDGTMKKRGLPVILAVILALGLSGTLVSCKANVELDPDAGGSPAVTDTSSIDTSSDPSASPAPESKDLQAVWEMAEDWAEAVKNRDGKAQYALMSKDLQEKVYKEFTELNWVTGTSSPWVESYKVDNVETSSAAPEYATAEVLLSYATSTGPAGSYQQVLTFIQQDGALKISAISDPVEVGTDTSSEAGVPTFEELIKLLGLTKDELLSAVSETPEPVDEGGLGFDKTGIRVWFDSETYTKVAQVLIMTDKIDINGVKVGDSYKDFKAVFGEPVSDNNGDAHFKYGDVYLSVVRDTSTDKTIAVYILAEDF